MQSASDILKEFMQWEPSEAFLELVSSFQAISAGPSEDRLREWGEAISQRRRDRGLKPLISPDLEEFAKQYRQYRERQKSSTEQAQKDTHSARGNTSSTLSSEYKQELSVPHRS